MVNKKEKLIVPKINYNFNTKERAKILFLDIDGVLNTYGASYRSFKKGSNVMEPMFVERLEWVMSQVPDLQIVISSSWRNNMPRLCEVLKNNGFTYIDRIIGKTIQAQSITERYDESLGVYIKLEPPFQLKYRWRGEQIKEYLKHAKLNSKLPIQYLVIDDEPFDICGDRCNLISKSNVLQTNMDEGLLNKDALKIVEFFVATKKGENIEINNS